MCRCIRLILCPIMISLIVFLGMALWSGGDKFRELGEKAGGTLETISEKLADKADEIREEVKGKKKKIDEWKTKKDEKSLDSIKNLKELKKEGVF